MATQTKDQANAAAVAAQTALTNAANARFIAEADAIMLDREAMGKKFVKLNLFQDVSLKDIVEYYRGYGYEIAAPNCDTWQACQPAQLFGFFWENYWNHNLICRCKTPCTVVISWK